MLRVRNGARIDIPVPWDVVASVETRRRDLPSSIRSLQPVETDDGTHLHVAVGGETNVDARLRRPLTVTTRSGPFVVTAVSFLVDDPRDFVAGARKRIAAAAPAGQA